MLPFTPPIEVVFVESLVYMCERILVDVYPVIRGGCEVDVRRSTDKTSQVCESRAIRQFAEM